MRVQHARPAIASTARSSVGALLAQGELRPETAVVEWLDHAPEALQRLFTGDHDGNLLVRVAGE